MNHKIEPTIFTWCQQKLSHKRKVITKFRFVAPIKMTADLIVFKKDQYWHMSTEMQMQTLKSFRYLAKRFVSISLEQTNEQNEWMRIKKKGENIVKWEKRRKVTHNISGKIVKQQKWIKIVTMWSTMILQYNSIYLLEMLFLWSITGWSKMGEKNTDISIF